MQRILSTLMPWKLLEKGGLKFFFNTFKSLHFFSLVISVSICFIKWNSYICTTKRNMCLSSAHSSVG